MQLNPDEITLFKQLSVSGTGKTLIAYLRRVQSGLFDPKTLSKENLDARKETAAVLEGLVERITHAGEDVDKEDINPYV